MNRLINVTTALGDRLRFSALSGHEEVSRLFDFALTLKSEDDNLSPDAMLGTSVTLEIALPGGGVRHLNGQCVHFAAVGSAGRFYLYEAQLKPWLWYATRRTDYRIFQKMTAPDMIRQVLADYPFEVRLILSRSYRTWEYCVQYRETDANFVMRMLENEGIWFWFDHSAGEHALVLTDDIGLRNPYPGYASIPYYAPDQTYPDKDHLDRWSAGQQVRSGQFMARDYNFTMPKADLAAVSELRPGHAHDSYECFDYPGGYDDLDQGSTYAKLRMEELQSTQARGHAAGRARGLAPGWLFTLEKHPVGKYNREYLIVAADYRFSDNDYEAGGSSDSHSFRIDIQTHPSDQPFRPQRLTPKPLTQGPDTATVTGPPGQEIHTDKYGRVTVSFPWNRYCSKDQDSSCWIRVSHPWAGSGFGGIHIPRIGQEVLVDYLHGDPDRPIITSRVYNALQMPPWGLPANATQSGFLTRSTLGGGYDNANALRFEDSKGAEQLWIHAERNQDIEVENDETHWVGNDRSKTIDRDETSHIKQDRTETVDRHETITVHGNRKEEVDGNETIAIHKNRTETVDLNEKISIGSNRTKSVGGNEKDSIGKNWSTQVGKAKTETIGMTYMQNVGMGRMDNVGMGYSLNVGLMMNTVVGMSQSTQAAKNQSTQVGERYSLQVGDDSGTQIAAEGGTLSVNSQKIEMTANTEIVLICGESSITMTPTSIKIYSPKVDVNS
ncbi:type VI secretion system Vgr family protein [Halopseudomonas salegens]|uniref:Type VI secretion system secreted protein VgrG n=1 Tax=Halopseudomonas salegens TaxID=1434072 RepID=A0A1H2EQH1_9GAMM|nr:type VI secretion system tip protein VgrG [Halopseudomonas salegens]SDT97432.1 type VI secretion system secreted protein VgrG [Halopseudomonas salegens]